MTLTDDEAGKLFVGGLSWETTQEKLRSYFSLFGEVVDSVVMKNAATGKSRGFGFVTFKDPDVVSIVLAQGSHQLDGKSIDPKSCTPRSQRRGKDGPVPKIFIGGLPLNVSESDVREVFSQFGPVHEVNIMFDQERKRNRGFGFLQFESADSTQRACSQRYVDIAGKQIASPAFSSLKVECKLAVPRDNVGRRGGYGGQQQQPPQQYQSNNWDGQQGNWNQGNNDASAPAYSTSWGSNPPAPQQQNYSGDGNYGSSGSYQNYGAPAGGNFGAGGYSAPQYGQPAYPAYGSPATQAQPASGGYNANAGGNYSAPSSDATYSTPNTGNYNSGGQGNYGAANTSSASNTAGMGAYSQSSSQYSPTKAYSGSTDSSSYQGNYGSGQNQDYRGDNASGGGYGASSQPSRSYGQQQQSYHPYRR